MERRQHIVLKLVACLTLLSGGCSSPSSSGNGHDAGDQASPDDVRTADQPLELDVGGPRPEKPGGEWTADLAQDQAAELDTVADAEPESDSAQPTDVPVEDLPADTGNAEEGGDAGGDQHADTDLPLPCVEGAPCDDDDPCTLDDQCVDAACAGVLVDCADGLACTFDFCQDGVCSNPMKPGWCFLAGACVKEGGQNPNNPCLECISAAKIYTWSFDDTNGCDDGDPCTAPDLCDNGECKGEPADCDDGNPCTEEACFVGDCEHLPLNGVACEDGDLCTLNDYCFAAECVAGETLRLCDDFNQCTDDVCDPVQGCIYTPSDNPCQDGNLCTIDDFCNAGQCLPGQQIQCDDGNPCTNDSCAPFVGCKHVNNAFPCDDGDPCSLGDQCTGGVCKKGSELNACDDANSCTSEWCAPFAGCQYFDIEAPCTDEDGCTIGDHCQDGQCVFDWVVACDDDNPCTDDICDEAFGCANVLNSSPCDDDNACTTGDQCSQGKCTAGKFPLSCFDQNPCASGSCDPDDGCVMTPLDGKPCDDGSVCTLGDKCLGGKCQAGATGLDCDDGNPCTADFCDPKALCLHENIESPCNDNSLCTKWDKCVDGSCLGTTVDCGDGNQCTIDSCDPWQGCQHAVVVSAFCQPQIIIDYPPRAAELTAPPSVVNVTGHVIHNAAPVAWVTINGQKTAVAADGTFSFPLQAGQGLNVIEAEVWDLFDGHDKVLQTFLLSSGYVPMNAANPEVSMIKDGVMIYLGPTVWDDNNPDPNDFATFFKYFFDSINMNDMIPSPLYESGEYKVTVPGGMTHGPFALDIVCIQGGLHLVATLPDVKMNLDADSKKWYLPDASGKVKASSIVIGMDVMLSVDAAGNVKAVLQNVTADVNGLDVSLDGLLGFLLNWIVDFFEGTFASTIEDKIEDALKSSLPPVLESALEKLAFDSAFDVPPLFGGAAPVTLTMKSRVSTLDFSPSGGVIGLKAAVVTPKGVDADSLGSLRRGGCLGQEAAFKFWMLNEIEMSLFDDFLNQIPYAMWWAGLLTIPLDAAALGGGSFEDYGIKDMNMVATALLPPVITDCPGSDLLLQMGDLELSASFVLWGMPVDVVMYATFEAEIAISVTQDGAGNSLGMAVKDVTFMDIELATVSENLVGSEDSLRLLVKKQVMPIFLEQITSNSLASIPLPSMDVGSMIPGAPQGTAITMTPKSTYRDKGYTAISGTVHE